MSDLFDFPVLRVEQPRKMLPTQVRYEIFNADNALLAVAAETDVRSRRKALLAARPGALPDVRSLVVSGADGAPLLTVEQQESRRLTLVRRPDGELVGAIRAERTTRHYTLLGAADQPVGTITGDLSLRHFVVSDDQGRRAALVNKKWAGLLAELLTTADRYAVEISDPVPEPLRTLVVMSAVVLDLTLHEFKDLV
ncbi:phospholipid scramblase-related protein [Actinomadura scrupuli]|uniref:phospholipid scramblase-related protein n=1 Tax=Actinomadura scrupuli TaxID=559629 RepID=UPI003D992AED